MKRSSLNHIYRTIWSEILNAWVAVSELVKAKGKRSGSSRLRVVHITNVNDTTGSLYRQRFRPILLALAYCFAINAQANPIGAQIVNGTVAISQVGNTLTVTNSPNAIINWQGFSIRQNEITNFVQQSAASSVLNRVVGPDPSQLLGALTSNGRVFLINPAGILVGQGARIDVAGFVASTLNLSNADFLAGNLNFGVTPNAGTIQNAGSITTPDGGTVYLVAPQIENSGIITTPRGETILAAGNSVQLIDSGTPGVTVQITGASNAATNLGQILADSGRIGMVGAVVKNSGSLSASSLVNQGGRIFLRATQAATVDAGSSIGASGTSGGTVEVLGNQVSVSGAIDASGTSNGGTILIGGDAHGANPQIQNAQNTFIADTATIRADGGVLDPQSTILNPQSGNGGKVVVWADNATQFNGNISAQGGALGGNGGWVEVSGKQSLSYTGLTNTLAANGFAGTLLLDPADFLIAATGGDMTGATLSTQLGLANVTITTALAGGTVGLLNAGTLGDITVSDAVTWVGATSLTLNAYGDVNLNSAITGTAGNLTLNAGGNGLGTAVITESGTGGLALASLVANSPGGTTLAGTNTITSLDVQTGGVTSTGTLNLMGTVTNATLTAANLFNSRGTLDGVTIGSNLALSGITYIANNLTLANGTTLDIGASTLYFNTTGAQNIAPAAAGAATVTMAGGSLHQNVGAQTLTLGTGLTVNGYGFIDSPFGAGLNNSIVNNGIINANVAGQSLSVTSDILTNNGTLRASASSNIAGGGLIIAPAAFTSGATGVLEASNGGSLSVGTAVLSTPTLNLNGGGINGNTMMAGQLTVTSVLNLDSVSWVANITLNALGATTHGSLATGAATLMLEEGTIVNNSGVWTVANGSSFIQGNQTGATSTGFNNLLAGTLTVAAGHTAHFAGTIFTNTGTLNATNLTGQILTGTNVTAGFGTLDNAAVINSSTVTDITGGNNAWMSAYTQISVFNSAAGTLLVNDPTGFNTSWLPTNMTVNNSGLLNIAAGVLNFDGTYIGNTGSSINIGSGNTALGGKGVLNVLNGFTTPTLTMSDGTLLGSGLTPAVVNVIGAMNFAGAPSALANVTLNTQGATAQGSLAGGATIMLENGAFINNSGIWSMGNGSSIIQMMSATPTGFNNLAAGTLSVAATNTAHIAGTAFTNAGILNATNTTGLVLGGTNVTAGFGSLDNAAVITNSGVMDITGVNGAGITAYTLVSFINNASGTLLVNNPVGWSTTLPANIAITNNGLLDVSGGILDVSGTSVNNGTMNVWNFGSLVLNGAAVNNGTLSIGDGGWVNVSQVGSLTNNGVIDLNTGGMSEVPMGAGIHVTGTFTNAAAGVINSLGSATGSGNAVEAHPSSSNPAVFGTLVNDGTVNVNANSWLHWGNAGSSTNAGAFNVAALGQLDISDSSVYMGCMGCIGYMGYMGYGAPSVPAGATYVYNGALTNNGYMNIGNSAGGTNTFNGTIANNGQLSMGTLDLNGAYTGGVGSNLAIYGKVTTPNPLTIPSLTINGGTLMGAGATPVSVDVSTTLAFDGAPSTLSNITLNVQGTTTQWWNGVGFMPSTGTTVMLENGASINNSGLWTMANDNSIIQLGAVATSFNNLAAGTLTVATGSIAHFAGAAFTNTGTLNATNATGQTLGGTVSAGFGTLDNAPVITNSGGTVWNIAGFDGANLSAYPSVSIINNGAMQLWDPSGLLPATTLPANVALTNNGWLGVQSGTLNLYGTYTGNANSSIQILTGGTLATASAITTPNLYLDGGTLLGLNAGAASNQINVTGSLNFSNGYDWYTGTYLTASTSTLDNITLNTSVATVTNLAGYAPWMMSNAPAAITLQNGAMINNGGVWTMADLSTITQGVGAQTAFNNNMGATLNVPTGVASINGTTFTNNGLVTGAGTLSLVTAVTNTGLWDITGLMLTGTLINTSTGTMSVNDITGLTPSTINAALINDGILEVLAGTLYLNGSYTGNAGSSINVAGGTLTTTTPLSTPTLNLTGGTITGSGNIAVSGAFNWGGANSVIAGSGTLTTQVGSTTALTPGWVKTNLLGGSRIWNNSGTVNFTPDVNYSYFQIDGTAVFNNLIGGVFNINASTTDAHIYGVGTFNNAGIVNKNLNVTTASSGIASVFNNQSTGVVNVISGTLALSGIGTDVALSAYNIGSGTILQFGASRTVPGSIAGAGTMSFAGGTTTVSGSYNVSGLTQISGTTTANFTGPVTNVGTSLVANSGTTTLNFGGISSGEGTAFANLTSISSTSTLTFKTGTVLSGLTALTVGGGTLDLANSSLSLATLDVTGGTLTGSGNIAVSGAFNWGGANSVIAGSGTLTTQVGSTTALTPGWVKTNLLGGSRIWNNSGTVNFTPDVNYSYFQIDGTAVFNNLIGGVFNINASTTDAHIYGVGTFNNAGIVNKNLNVTTASSGIASVFNNQSTGVVNVTSGTLALSGIGTDVALSAYNIDSGTILQFGASRTVPGSIAGAGTMSFAGGTTTVSGSYNVSGLTQISGTTTANFTGPVTNVGTSLVANSGTTTLNFGGISSGEGSAFANLTSISSTSTLTFKTGTVLSGLTALTVGGGTLDLANSSLSLATLDVTGGTLTGSGNIDVSGTFNWASSWGNNSAITGSGTLTTQVGSTTALTPGWVKTNLLGGSRIWNNSGTVNFTPDVNYSYFQIDGTAVFNNLSGGVFNINASTSDAHINGAGTFNNAGIVNKNLNGTAASSGIASAFNNQSTGVVNANSGTFNVTGAFTQSGTINVAAGAAFSDTTGFTNTGTLSGAGTIAVGTLTAGLTNSGIINPGGTGAAGTLNISGDLQLSTGSILNIELGGTATGQSDVLAVTGNITNTAGTLNSSLLGGYVPANADFVPFMTYGGLTATGNFATANLPVGFNAGYNLAVNEAARLIYATGPTTATFTNVGGTLDWALATNWSTGVLPGISDTALISAGLAVTHAIGADSIAALTINALNSLNISGGSLTVSGITILGGTLTVSGTGSAALNGALNGAATGVLNVAAGSLSLGGAASVNALNITGGTLNGTGSLVVTSSFNQSLGTLGNTFTSIDITQAAGNLAVGGMGATGAVNLTSTAGALSVNGSISGQKINTQSASGVTLNATLTASGTATAIVLDAGSGNFINNAGANALSTVAGRWLVYSADPAQDTFGGLVSNSLALWGKTGANYAHASVMEAGNRYLFSTVPVLNVGVVNQVKTYGSDLTLTPPTATVTGLVNAALYGGVFVQDATTGAASLTSAGFASNAAVNAGTPYAITVSAGTLATPTGYGVTTYTHGQITVNPFALTVTATGVNRVYDSTIAATVALSNNGFAGDVLTTGYTAAAFLDKNVADGKTVSVSGITLAGLDAANYTFNTTAATTANITPFALTGSVTSGASIYGDALTAGAVNFGNLFAGDALTATVGINTAGLLSSSGNLVAGAHAGIQSVTALGGLAAGNYTFAGISGDYAVTARTLTGTITAGGNTYGAALNAGILNIGNTITGDAVSAGAVSINTAGLTSGSGNLIAGTHIGIQTVGATLTGADAANYVFAGAAADYTVTQATLTVGAAGISRIYDATTVATVTLSDNRFANDVLTTSYTTAAFLDKNVGTAKQVDVSGITLAGTDAGNYTFNSAAAATANITPFALTGNVTAGNSIYGDALPVGTVIGNMFAGDNLIAMISINTTGLLSGSGNLIAGTHVGIQSVTALVGLDAGNYTFAGISGDYAVAARTLSGTIAAGGSVYGAALNAGAFSLGNAIAGDVVSAGAVSINSAGLLSASGNLVAGIHAGIQRVGATLIGADAANYVFAGAMADYTVTQAVLTVGAAGISRIYDATTVATVTLSDNRFANDVLTTSHTTAAFLDKNVGTAKQVNVSGITLVGADAGNYTFNATVSTTANISARPLSTWTGQGGNTLWNNPLNWDVLPDLNNVTAVSIPVAFSVTYDASMAGITGLQTLTSAGTLLFTGGTLNIGNALTASDYQQTGGSLTGTGNLNVTGNFSQTGGTITLTGAAIASITQAIGNLNIANLSAPTINLAASAGGIVGGTIPAGSVHLSAPSMKLTAATGIGSAAAPLRLVAASLDANTASGGGSLINTPVAAVTMINFTTNDASSLSYSQNGQALTLTGIMSSQGGSMLIDPPTNFTMNVGSSMSSGGGAIGLLATGNILLSSINAGTGIVSLNTSGGSIGSVLPAGQSNIIAGNVTASATTGARFAFTAPTATVTSTGGTVLANNLQTGATITNTPVVVVVAPVQAIIQQQTATTTAITTPTTTVSTTVAAPSTAPVAITPALTSVTTATTNTMPTMAGPSGGNIGGTAGNFGGNPVFVDTQPMPLAPATNVPAPTPATDTASTGSAAPAAESPAPTTSTTDTSTANTSTTESSPDNAAKEEGDPNKDDTSAAPEDDQSKDKPIEPPEKC